MPSASATWASATASTPPSRLPPTAASLLTPVYGQRDRVSAEGVLSKDYWITDGLYGSFNCILYDDQKPQPLVVLGAGNAGLVPCGTRSRSSRSQVGSTP